MSVTRATTGRTQGESRQVLLSSQGGLPRGGIFQTGLKDEEATLGGLGPPLLIAPPCRIPFTRALLCCRHLPFSPLFAHGRSPRTFLGPVF